MKNNQKIYVEFSPKHNGFMVLLQDSRNAKSIVLSGPFKTKEEAFLSLETLRKSP